MFLFSRRGFSAIAFVQGYFYAIKLHCYCFFNLVLYPFASNLHIIKFSFKPNRKFLQLSEDENSDVERDSSVIPKRQFSRKKGKNKRHTSSARFTTVTTTCLTR